MTTASQIFAISVTAAGGGSLPGSNQVVLVGTNTMDSLLSHPRLSVLANLDPRSQNAFSSHDFNYALHGAYGAGSYVPGVGTNGAYIAVNGGGDGAPCVYDGVVFSFDDFTWRLVQSKDSTGADAPKNSQYKLPQSIADAGPYIEVTGYSQVPACAQHYHMATGHNGKFIRLCGGAMLEGGSRHTPYTHTWDPATGRYRRWTTTPLPYFQSEFWKEAYAHLDTTRINSSVDRVWHTDYEMAYHSALNYLDLSTDPPVWRRSVSFPVPSVTGGSSGNYPTHIFVTDGTHKGIIAFKLSGGVATFPRLIDLTTDATTAQGWKDITLTGSLAAFDKATSSGPSHDQNLNVRWERYPGDNCLYTYDGFSGKITKITPPAYANWLTSAWTVSTITPTGSALPTQYGITNLPHYTRFFYVSGLNCFAWVAGGPNQVALWKPA
jgi:hypothetical protein